LQSNQAFRDLPPPTGQPPFHLSLDTVLPADQIQRIQTAQRLVFHVAGDTGGVKSAEPQQIVAMKMEDDIGAAAGSAPPAFFYHLGDVVYYYGEASEYYAQFYEPYAQYPAPIIAIPGNHDGDTLDPATPTLAAFVENFCAASPHVTPEAGDAARQAMTQPNVYFTLEAPLVTIIGLYTNVPEGGRLDDNQITWFQAELAQAPTNKALIVAMHHPVYSQDAHHGGSSYMAQLLDTALAAAAGRMPDLVLSGHVHNYQRFTRQTNGRQVPHIVAGAGGYWHLHYMTKDFGYPIPVPVAMPNTDVTLEQYCDNRHGFLHLEVTPQVIQGTYFGVPRPHEAWGAAAQQIDSFTLDLTTHRLR
jgi:3',5'-cyclic AMP phosphodiesterase CpdA